jgi:hypothetical protein
MWPARIASSAILAASAVVIVTGHGLVRYDFAEDLFREFVVVGNTLIAFAYFGALISLGGLLASFGLRVTDSGKWEPKPDWYGRLVGFLTNGSESYCEASTAMAYAIFVGMMCAGYLVFEVWEFSPQNPDALKTLFLPLCLIVAIASIAATFFTPYGRRHWLELFFVGTVCPGLVIWEVFSIPSTDTDTVSHPRTPHAIELMAPYALSIAVVTALLVLIIVVLKKRGYYERVCPLRNA